MKNIIVLLGSPRKGDSYRVCQDIEKKMKDSYQCKFEYIQLSQMHIEECRGCGLCLNKGETYCPLKDDMRKIIDKVTKADGIVIASPVYACQITGTLKKVMDRLAYLCHRPVFINKPFINIITTAGGGIKPTAKYMKMIVSAIGGKHVDTLAIIAPMYYSQNSYCNLYSKKYYHKMQDKMSKMISRLMVEVNRKEPIRPSYYDIYLFNGLRSKTYMSKVDYNYWEEKGWLDATYYYDIKISIGKRIFGYTLTYLIKQAWKRMQRA